MPKLWFNVSELEVYPYKGTPPEISNLCVKIDSARNIIERYGIKGAIPLARDLQDKFGGYHEPQQEDEDVETYIWRLFNDEIRLRKRNKARQRYAERVGEQGVDKRYRGGRGKRKKPRDYEIKFDPLDNHLAHEYAELPPQARRIIDALYECGTRILDEQTAVEVVEAAHQREPISAKQTSHRIFKYYEAELERKGMLQRRYHT